MVDRVVPYLRQWRDAAMDAHLQESAQFWGDAVLSITAAPADALALARSFHASRQHLRALSFLSPSLKARDIDARLLAAECLAALSRWPEVKAVLSPDKPGRNPYDPQSNSTPLDALAANFALGVGGSVGLSRVAAGPAVAAAVQGGGGWWGSALGATSTENPVNSGSTAPSSAATSSTATSQSSHLVPVPNQPSRRTPGQALGPASVNSSASVSSSRPSSASVLDAPAINSSVTAGSPRLGSTTGPGRGRGRMTAASSSITAQSFANTNSSLSISPLPSSDNEPKIFKHSAHLTMFQSNHHPNEHYTVAPPAPVAGRKRSRDAISQERVLGIDMDDVREETLIVGGVGPILEDDWNELPSLTPPPVPFPPQVILASLQALADRQQRNEGAAIRAYKEAAKGDPRCWEGVEGAAGHMRGLGGGWGSTDTFLSTLPTSHLPLPLRRLLLLLYLIRLGAGSLTRLRWTIEALEREFGVKRRGGVELAWAEGLMVDGRWGDAIEVTASLLSQDPHNPSALFLHASLLTHLRLPTPLFRFSHLLHTHHPDASFSLFASGCYHLASGRFEEARKWFLRCTQVEYSRGEAWIGFGHGFAEEGEHDSAVAAYAEAGKVVSGSHLPDLFIGMEHLKQGNLVFAKGYFDSATKKCPSDSQVHNEKGMYHYREGSYLKALQCFREALQWAGESDMRCPSRCKETWCNVGNTLIKLSRYDEASTTFRHILTAFPNHQPAHIGLAFADHLAWRLGTAIESYHRALAMGPSDFCQDMLVKAIEEVGKAETRNSPSANNLDDRFFVPIALKARLAKPQASNGGFPVSVQGQVDLISPGAISGRDGPMSGDMSVREKSWMGEGGASMDETSPGPREEARGNEIMQGAVSKSGFRMVGKSFVGLTRTSGDGDNYFTGKQQGSGLGRFEYGREGDSEFLEEEDNVMSFLLESFTYLLPAAPALIVLWAAARVYVFFYDKHRYWGWDHAVVDAKKRLRKKINTDNLAFPADFLWVGNVLRLALRMMVQQSNFCISAKGVATAAHQVEGGMIITSGSLNVEASKPLTSNSLGCTNNNWAQFEAVKKPDGSPAIHNGDSALVACEHWTRYPEDIQLMSAIGLNSYRFSIEWSKIVPREGVVDREALAHYKDVLDALEAKEIVPMITLFHFTNPIWFEEKGGWEKAENIQHFVFFTKVVFAEFGTRVKHWCTFNEPEGKRTAHNLVGVVMTNILDAHVQCYKLIKSMPGGDKTMIGWAKSYFQYEPNNPLNPIEVVASWRTEWLMNGSLLEFFRSGNYNLHVLPFNIPFLQLANYYNADGPNSMDFIGLNYYSHNVSGFGHPWEWHQDGIISLINKDGLMTDMHYSVYPEGFYHALKEMATLNKPVIVTENGIADANDTRRHLFFRRYLYAMSKAISEGVDVRGYFHWTLMDNFEWAEGYESRFGLFETNFETQERTMRDSCKYFMKVIQLRAINPRDRWSGHIAWPGGRQEGGETDKVTAVRETYEEIGLDLTDAKAFSYVGEIDQREVKAFTGSRKWMTISCFVYIQIIPETPEMRLQKSEIAESFWVPLHHLRDILRLPDPSKSPHWRPITYEVSSMILDNGLFKGLEKNGGPVGKLFVFCTRIFTGFLLGKISFGGILLEGLKDTHEDLDGHLSELALSGSSRRLGLTDSQIQDEEYFDVADGDEDRLLKSMHSSIVESSPDEESRGKVTASGWFDITGSAKQGQGSNDSVKPPSVHPSEASPKGQRSVGSNNVMTTDDFACEDSPPVLWGLTLWMTSDLLDLTFPSEIVPRYPLHYHAKPTFEAWDVNTFMKVLHHESDEVHRRKPMLGSRREDGEDSGDVIPLAKDESIEGAQLGEATGPYPQQATYAYPSQAYSYYPTAATSTGASEPLAPGVAATTTTQTPTYSDPYYAAYYQMAAYNQYASIPATYPSSATTQAQMVAAAATASPPQSPWHKPAAHKGSSGVSYVPPPPGGSYNRVTYESAPAYTAVPSRFLSSGSSAASNSPHAHPTTSAPSSTGANMAQKDTNNSTPTGDSSKTKQTQGWPESLKRYVQRVFTSCNPTTRPAAEKWLGEVVGTAANSSTLWNIDWDNKELPPMCNPPPEKKDVKFGLTKVATKLSAPKVQLDAMESRSETPPQDSSPKLNGKRKRLLDELPTSEADKETGRSWDLFTGVDDDDEQRRRENRANRFAPKEVHQPLFQALKKNKKASTVRRSIASTLDVPDTDESTPDPNVIDWDKYTIVGTSERLDKPYLRLTSAPDPSTVRPLHILEKSLKQLLKKWESNPDYTYICDQFKSIRQDLTVQRIKNKFTIQVYEEHARIALVKLKTFLQADLGEFNQCQTQLKHLYREVGNSARTNEFIAYRLLYQLHTLNRRDINTLLKELSPEQKADVNIKHALSVRKAVAEGDYHTLFVLYHEVPPILSAHIMDHFVMRERLRALKVMCSAYKMNFSLEFAAEELGFRKSDHSLDILDLVEFLGQLELSSTNGLSFASLSASRGDQMDVDEPQPQNELPRNLLVDVKVALPILVARLNQITKKIDIRGQI
ncbi:hypothetical protein HDU93_009550 [Gonapodya sp. JEL0774]|nr:hypothetical protein HDU93_009550 [Gonapodya sp. JEL0774]